MPKNFVSALALFGLLIAPWAQGNETAEAEPMLIEELDQATIDEQWERINAEWRYNAQMAQRLLEQTPVNDWWARASLLGVLHPHSSVLLEWERLAYSALQQGDWEQARAALLLAPQDSSPALRLRLLNAWVEQDAGNLAPQLRLALINGRDGFAALEKFGVFERYDSGLFAVLESLAEAAPEGLSLPPGSDGPPGLNAGEIVWMNGMGLSAASTPGYGRLPCLDIDYLLEAIDRERAFCLELGELMETTSTDILGNLIGVAVQRRWFETLGDEAGAAAVEARGAEIRRLQSKVSPDFSGDPDAERELFLAWRGLAVDHGEVGALRWLEENCDNFDSSASCLLGAKQ